MSKGPSTTTPERRQSPPNLPETRPARLALARVERAIRADRVPRGLSPLSLHGPSGCGKSTLINQLVARLSEAGDEWPVVLTTGRDLGRWTMQPEMLTALETARLFVIEDLANLPAANGDLLAHWLDRLIARRVPVIVTLTEGPARLLRHGERLRSRLGGGLVVQMSPLGPKSRRQVLDYLLAVRALRLEADALAWLVGQTPGSFRQLAGVVAQIAGTSYGNEPLALAEVQQRLSEQTPTTTVEQIVRVVGQYYRVSPTRLRGKSRERAALVPRQVGMFLARTLTDLSLERIGTYFGGRDHTTVLHACRKVEQALTDDPHLAGAVRTLRTTLETGTTR